MPSIIKLHFNPFFDLDIYFDFSLDQNKSSFNEDYVGMNGLLDRLELYLGCKARFSNDNKRVRLYREGISKVSDNNAFYHKSFVADPSGTASELLAWRDELILGGLNFGETDLPGRVADLARVEKEFTSNSYHAFAGTADRWRKVLEKISNGQNLPALEIEISFPGELRTGFEKSVIHALKKHSSVKITECEYDYEKHITGTDLGMLKEKVKQIINDSTGNSQLAKIKFKGDNSIRIFKGADPVELGYFLKEYLNSSGKENKTALTSGDNLNILSLLLESDGQPSPRIDSNPPEDAFLQIVKLIPACIWKPLDIHAFLELLLFPELPFDNFLAKRMARVISKKPGRMSEDWENEKAEWQKYMLEKKKIEDKKVKELIAEFASWTESKLFNESGEANQQALRHRITELYAKLGHWANRKHAVIKEKDNRVAVRYKLLYDICQEIIESVNNLISGDNIGKLRFQQMVKEALFSHAYTIKPADIGCIRYAANGFNLADSPGTLIYWNAIKNKAGSRMKWLPEETEWFGKHGISYSDPLLEHKRSFRADMECILRTRDEMTIVIPESSKGEEVETGAIYAVLSGLCENLYTVEFHVPEDAGKIKIGLQEKKMLKLPEMKEYWEIKHPALIRPRENESYSSLENLLYYPYAWVLNYHARIAPAITVSMTSDPALMGTLAHRFIELLAKDDAQLQMSETTIKDKLNAIFNDLLEKEGAILLLPERIKDKNYFLYQLEKAIPFFIQQCKENNWKEIRVEQTLEGKLGDIPVKSRADILLKKDNDKAVVDIKQFQSKKLQNLLETDGDIQLVLYSGLWAGYPNMARSAYFFVNKCKIMAKNDLAFRQAEIAGDHANDAEARNRETWIKMINTAKFRLEEIASGRIEAAEEMEIGGLSITGLRDARNLLDLPVQEKKSRKAPDLKKPKDYNDYSNLLKVN